MYVEQFDENRSSKNWKPRREDIMGKLTGKVAVVTGASKGIGAGIAKALGAEGASVVVNYASDKTGADKTVAETKKAFGKVDILVNNAGVYAFAPLEEITEEEINRIYSTNVTGLLLTTKAAVKLFPSEGGSVINIGSVVSELTPPNSSIYTGTKGAVDAITRVLAKELGPKKIRVNAVNPGLTITEGVQSAGIAGSDFENNTVADTPLGRAGKPEDIADVVTFIASDDARWITGSLLQAGGGLR